VTVIHLQISGGQRGPQLLKQFPGMAYFSWIPLERKQ